MNKKRILLITYNLHSWHNYIAFYDKLKELCPDYIHIEENGWLVYTDIEPDDLRKEIWPLMYYKPGEGSDILFICEVVGESCVGFAATSVWKWIKERKDGKIEEKPEEETKEE